MKKVLSIILTVCLVLSVFSVCAAAVADDGSTCTCGKSPIIYVLGKQPIYDENGKDVLDEDTMDIVKAAQLITASFGLGFVDDDWSAYSDTVYSEIAPFYKEYALDKNGNVWNNTHPEFTWSADTMEDTHQSPYVKNCVYSYDCRLDPLEVADDFNNFIECVKKVTGHTKVSLVGRCLGTNIITAYLQKYASKTNYSGIDTVVFYAPTVEGVDLLNQLFCGKIKVDPTKIGSYASDLIDIDDLEVMKVVSATLDLVYAAGFTGKGTDYANEVLATLYENCIPSIIRDTYGTMPGFWSMISDDCYDAAKNYVFGEDEQSRAEYQVLINKIDNYHYNVQNNATDMFAQMKNVGVKFAVFAKYGLQLMPVVENCDILSDNTISTARQSFGATTSTVNGKLSDEYIAGLEDKSYVSLDKKVDASTALFRDETWFIKDLEHTKFPDSVNDLISAICKSKGQLTVKSLSAYPQYMKWTEETGIVPLTAENTDGGHESENTYSGTGNQYEIKNAFMVWVVRLSLLILLWIGGEIYKLIKK